MCCPCTSIKPSKVFILKIGGIFILFSSYFFLRRAVLFVGCGSGWGDLISTESRGFKCHLHN